jgi:ribosomal RNA assembly protein
MQHVKIPQDRIGALIGEGGETMREIEDRAEVRLDIDSETGQVAVETTGDPVTALKGPDIVKAIGRGFAPEEAMRLLDDELMLFEIIDIDAASRNKNDLTRHKGLMEELSGASVVIYGSTLGIIGDPDQVEAVREAAQMILDGAPHGAVYSFLEDRHNEMKHRGMEYHRFTG